MTNIASNLDYGGQLTASSAVLPSGALATMQDQTRSGNAPYTDVAMQLEAAAPNTSGLANYGDVQVRSSATLTVQQGLSNNGLIALASTGNAVLAISGAVSINGPGTITLDNPTDSIAGATGSDTFTNSNLIIGKGTIGGNGLAFTNFGTVDATEATLTLGGGGTLDNQGVMEAVGGTLTINGPVVNQRFIESVGFGGGQNPSEVVINGPVVNQGFFPGYLEVLGGEMVPGSSVAAAQNIYFSATAPSELVLADPAGMKGNILYLNQGNTIDVEGVIANASSLDSTQGMLNLLFNGTTVAALNMTGISPSGTITLTSDQKGGTLVELVSSTFSGLGVSPSVAVLPGGGYVAIFQAGSASNPAGGVSGQLFDNSGQAIGGAFQIDPSGKQPTVAAQTTGQFMVCWADDTSGTIRGQIYNADGSVATATFDLTTAASGTKDIDPALTAEGSGYLLTYDVDDLSSKSVSTYYQAFNAAGQPVGSASAYPDVALNEAGVTVPITDIYNPRVVGSIFNADAGVDTALAPIIAMVDDFAQYSASNPTAIAMTMPSELSLFGSSIASGQASSGQLAGASIARGFSASPSTVLLTPIDDGIRRVSPEITELSNGDFVGVWDQLAPGDTTWSVVGQIVDATGAFVGPAFTLSTLVPAASTPTRPVLNALPNGNFVVIYSDADSSLAGQRFDASGHPLGSPFGVSNATQGNSAAVVLSDGTLLTLTGSGGIVSAGTFSVQLSGAAWSGANGTDLGTDANWLPVAVPSATDTLTFNLATGGTLTGSVSGMNAEFDGGAWLMQGATLMLAGETIAPSAMLALTDNVALTVNGGSIGASGSLDIETPIGVAMAVEGGAQVGILGLTLALGGGQSGALAVSGAGTAILDTGTAGPAEIGGSGAGQVTISGGASMTNSAGAVLGFNAGGEGSLRVTGNGSQVETTGEIDVGVSGTGHFSISNGATVGSGGNAAALSQGFDIGETSGGAGDATVTGTNSMLTNAGRFVVGDGGVGSLSILAGGDVTTTPVAVAGLAGLVVANTSGASGSSVNVSGAGSTLGCHRRADRRRRRLRVRCRCRRARWSPPPASTRRRPPVATA